MSNSDGDDDPQEALRRFVDRVNGSKPILPRKAPAAILDRETVLLQELIATIRRNNEVLAAHTKALNLNTATIEEAWRRYDAIEGDGEEWKDA